MEWSHMDWVSFGKALFNLKCLPLLNMILFSLWALETNFVQYEIILKKTYANHILYMKK